MDLVLKRKQGRVRGLQAERHENRLDFERIRPGGYRFQLVQNDPRWNEKPATLRLYSPGKRQGYDLLDDCQERKRCLLDHLLCLRDEKLRHFPKAVRPMG